MEFEKNNENLVNSIELVARVPLDALTEVRKGTFLSPNTEVLIYTDGTQTPEHFEIQFNKPLKSKDMRRMLNNYTELEYSPKGVANAWSGFAEGSSFTDNTTTGIMRLYQEQIPILKDLGKELGQVLDSTDNSQFVTEVAKSFKSKSQTWYKIISNFSFVSDLDTEVLSGVYTKTPYEEPIKQFLEKFRNTWADVAESFKETDPNAMQRAEIIERSFQGAFPDSQSYFDFQRKVIEKKETVRYEYSTQDADEIYFVGDTRKINIHKVADNQLRLFGDNPDFSALAQVEENGVVSIHPGKSKFVIPVICYEDKGGGRAISLQSYFSGNRESLIVPFGDNVEVYYHGVDTRINQLAGLMVAYDLFVQQVYPARDGLDEKDLKKKRTLKVGQERRITRQKPRIGAETLPYAALHDIDTIFSRAFFNNVERVSKEGSNKVKFFQ